MVERADPARAGVKAGRVVGVLTACLSVAALLGARHTYYEQMARLTTLAGVGGAPVGAIFWGNVALTAAARYTLAYVGGSLVGVVYDWLDRPSLAALTVLVLVVGSVDAAVAAVDTHSAAFGAGFLVAWLCYVPAFAYAFDGEGADRDGPLRLE
ncbi:MAG: hypothetical protein ABEH83_03360 [Halobacterium sp.]